MTWTYPTVTTSQNGSNSAITETTQFDSRGYPIWFRDAGGFLHYSRFDVPTGALVRSIADVNTSQTSDFTGLPSGWSTPSGGGLHRLTDLEVDTLGRATRYVDPNGISSYWVYSDSNFEIRQYAGWNSSTNLPTGPTEVMRYDRARGY